MRRVLYRRFTIAAAAVMFPHLVMADEDDFRPCYWFTNLLSADRLLAEEAVRKQFEEEDDFLIKQYSTNIVGTMSKRSLAIATAFVRRECAERPDAALGSAVMGAYALMRNPD